MRIFKDKRLRLILVLVLMAGILLIIKVFDRLNHPLITETSPTNGQKSVSVTEKISLTFNQDVSVKNWLITALPNFSFKLEVKKNILTIIPSSSLAYDTQYRLEIRNSTIKNFFYSFSFNTALSPTPPIEGLGNPYFHENAARSMAINYPLLKYLRYETKDYIIDYIGPLKLRVILKRDNSIIRQEVLSWIASKGVDPKTHQIVWKTQK